MSCFRPLRATRTAAGEVVLGNIPGGNGRPLELPCGRCIGCKLDRARAWSVRITHEAQLYDSNLFLTLTYRDEDLPEDKSLHYEDFQLFMKRLRFRLKGVSVGPNGRRPIRFFVAGEYGGLTKRPHFHAILFNTLFPDQRKFVNGTWWSGLAEELWSKGNVVIGSVTPASAAYVAGYSLKKVHGQAAKDAYEDVVNLRTGEVSCRRPEMVAMSRRPGIGAWWYDRFAGDLFPFDHAVQCGQEYKVPRYYLEKYKLTADAGAVEEMMYGRFLRAEERREDSTPERRAVREEVAVARSNFYGRGL